MNPDVVAAVVLLGWIPIAALYGRHMHRRSDQRRAR
jgi:hypothetical protein